MVWSVVLMETHPLLTNRKPYLDDLLYKNEVFAIIGATIEVHNTLGNGFLEPVYQEAMEIEIAERKIPAKSQHEIAIKYKNVQLKKYYVADLLCFDKVIVELKAMDKLTSREESQLINYLKASDLQVGLLLNFGTDGRLEWRRLALTGHGSTKQPPRILRETETQYKIRED